jgi:hypothetical protein
MQDCNGNGRCVDPSQLTNALTSQAPVAVDFTQGYFCSCNTGACVRACVPHAQRPGPDATWSLQGARGAVSTDHCGTEWGMAWGVLAIHAGFSEFELS